MRSQHSHSEFLYTKCKNPYCIGYYTNKYLIANTKIALTDAVIIRPLTEDDVPAANRIFRLAFGTFLGLKDPSQFSGDADNIRTRLRADPSAALAAEVSGELVGSNFVANWGSVGVFGPLTIHPNLWEKGIAKQLLKSTMEYFTKLGTRHIGLFTWPHSPKHLGLYQKFGFWPRFLTAIMAKQLVADEPKADRNITLDKNENENENKTALEWSRYSELPTAKDQRECLNNCCNLTNSIYDGLDLQLEINSVNTQRLGDTVLLWEDGSGTGEREKRKLIGLAVCHCGAGTEAGSGVCYIKFGGVFSGANSPMYFDRLIDVCETFAKGQGLSRLVAGVNTGRYEAYRKLISQGFRTEFHGVVMDKPNEPAYNNPETYLIDDWR